MIRWRVIELLKARGVTTAYQLSERTSLGYPTARRLFKGETDRVDLATLGELCALLDCQPGDLLEYVPDRQTKKVANA